MTLTLSWVALDGNPTGRHPGVMGTITAIADLVTTRLKPDDMLPGFADESDWAVGYYDGQNWVDATAFQETRMGRFSGSRPCRSMVFHPQSKTGLGIFGGDFTHNEYLTTISWGESRTSERPEPALIGTDAPQKRAQLLTSHGLDLMLSLKTQQAKIDAGDSHKNTCSINLDAGSACAVFYRELFFHSVMPIADTLNRHGQFEPARHRYHHIFCPDLIGGRTDANDKTPFWRYRTLCNRQERNLMQTTSRRRD